MSWVGAAADPAHRLRGRTARQWFAAAIRVGGPIGRCNRFADPLADIPTNAIAVAEPNAFAVAYAG